MNILLVTKVDSISVRPSIAAQLILPSLELVSFSWFRENRCSPDRKVEEVDKENLLRYDYF